MSEDHQMQGLRRDLENHLREKKFEQKVEDELKRLLSSQAQWEANIKQACLTKIQNEKELSNVNIDALTE